MLLYVDLLSEAELCSDAYPVKEEAKGAVLSYESKKVTEGALEINTGANASAEGGGEEVEDGAEIYINIVRAHSLTKIELSKKEYKAFMKSYWKLLLKKLNKNILYMAGFDGDYEAPSDKKEAKAELEAKAAELGKYDRPTFDAAVAQLAQFKNDFAALTDFVKTTVAKNFSEYEFYISETAELGECLIVPARYIGDAAAPNFYLIKAGCKLQKE
jgi:hypothetical protein